MEFDVESICINIFEAMRYPNYVNSCYRIDVVDLCVEHMFELEHENVLKVVLAQNLGVEDPKKTTSEI